MAKQRIEVNTVKSQVTVPHLGITLRTLFGAALDAWHDPQPGEARDHTVIYKDKEIATIRVKQHPLESN